MRLWRPSLLVFVVALLASLGIHLPVYEVLGGLADTLLHAPAAPKNTTVELEIAPLAQPAPEPTLEPARVPEPKLKKAEAEPLKPPEREREPKKEPEKEPAKIELEPVPTPEAQPAPPLPTETPLAVTQKSEDPDVPPPENPHFIAEDNRRVEQESIARVRNMQRDDQQPEPSARPSTADKPEAGDAKEDDVADLQNVQGSEERAPNPREAEQKPEKPSEASAGKREADALSRAEPAPQPAAQQVAPSQASGAPATGGEEQTLVVHDAAGSFVIRKRPVGKGEGEAGNALQPGMPTASRTNRASSQQRPGQQPNLNLSWTQFEDTFGSEELREQRQAYIAQRRSQSAGQNRQARWRKFRAAIENFVPNVQPGDQTALNAAASPFAAYLATIHRNIHREFAFGFLANLPIAGGPFDDRSLFTTLEIVINGDGSVHKVGIAKTSGFLPFDYGAFDAVMRAAPYPPPPRKILTGDGRVYVHWSFYRNERACGTFNAQPYILPHPPGTPDTPSPLRDEPPSDQHPPANYQPHDGELGMLLQGTDRSRER